jgi:nucleoid-associated protein YgaU
MTADAKIGLLLALVFIVAITFVINGLPAFLNKNKEADTTTYVNHYKEQQPALVGPSRNIAPILSHKPEAISVITEKPQVDLNSPAEARYQTLMPAAQEAVKTTETIDTNTSIIKQEFVEVKPAAKPAETQKTSVITYTVSPGDNLEEIAQKMYGPEIGKKQSSIDKIYNANKDKLSSKDSIQAGQTLVIPQIEGNKTNTLVKTGIFEKISDKVSKITSPQTAKAQPVKETAKEQYRIYVVKESDSLWQIAQKQLGNGNRFNEIIQLNQSAFADPEKLSIGMKLKLPLR